MMFFGYKLVITELWNFDFILFKKKKVYKKHTTWNSYLRAIYLRNCLPFQHNKVC